MPKINVYNHVKEILNCTYSSLHKNIRDEGDELIITLLKNCNEQKEPRYYHIAGVPCTGKSTFIKNNIGTETLGTNAVIVSFDEIMLSLTGYKNDLASLKLITTKNLAELFSKYEMPARIIGYELLQQSIDANVNIIFENSGSFAGHIDLMQNLKNIGYFTVFHGLECDIETSLNRALIREKIENRHTPEALIIQRFEWYNKLKPKYISVADEFFITTTN